MFGPRAIDTPALELNEGNFCCLCGQLKARRKKAGKRLWPPTRKTRQTHGLPYKGQQCAGATTLAGHCRAATTRAPAKPAPPMRRPA
jgi:hypothetical protein